MKPLCTTRCSSLLAHRIKSHLLIRQTGRLKFSSASPCYSIRPQSPPPARRGPFSILRDFIRTKRDESKSDLTVAKRNAWIMLGVYVACAIGGIVYLNDTKYKATGEPNPYKKPESSKEPLKDDGKSPIVEPHDTTLVYEQLAAEYDDKIWFEELISHIWWMRRRLMRHVEGDVLEVSCGTGRNIKYFKPSKVGSITLLDSSLAMLEQAKLKFEKKFPNYNNVQYVQGHAEDLSKLAARSGQRFDTVYESFGLCSHEDPDAALANMRDVLRPGGKIVLLEHGRGSWESMNKRLDERAEERSKTWGCRWNLDIAGIVERSGLEIETLGHYHFGTISFYVLREPHEENKAMLIPV